MVVLNWFSLAKKTSTRKKDRLLLFVCQEESKRGLTVEGRERGREGVRRRSASHASTPPPSGTKAAAAAGSGALASVGIRALGYLTLFEEE